MKENRIPQAGDFYLHFKNKLYQIITIATHSETKESLVIYQALYGDYGVYARPLDMFLSEIDHEKYPNIQQKYRFQYISKENLLTLQKNETGATSYVKTTTVVECQNDRNQISENQDNHQEAEAQNEQHSNEPMEEEVKRVPLPLRLKKVPRKTLSDFLDADSMQEKLEILGQMQNYIDDFTLDSMAVCLDYVPNGNSIEERYYGILKFLEMKINYESKR